MLDLSQAGAPDTIEVAGVSFAIHTDFRFFIKLDRLLKEKSGDLKTSDFIEIESLIYNTPYRPINRSEGIKKIFEFYTNKKELPRPTGQINGEIILDFVIDSELIYSAFMQVYHIDLIDESTKLHWWKFNALLDGLKGTKLNDVMGYRSYDESDTRDVKHFDRDMLRAWRIEKKLTNKEQEELNKFDALFYNA